MAIMAIKNPTTLKIKHDCGLDENRNKIIKTKSFGNVRTNAVNDDIYDVAEALSSLQEHMLVDVIKVETTLLSV
ncbi:MAG: DUF1659 domain-containing protein [Paraclostridium sp.]